MKTRIIALIAGLLAVLPTTSVWAATGYANLTVRVSPEGAGKVCVSTSKTQPNVASYKENEMTLVGSGNISSFLGMTFPASITLYAWVNYDSEAYQFLGWSEKEGGSIISTTIPKKHTISSSNTTSPGDGFVLYANFKCLKTDPFSVKFVPAVHGSYTANAARISDETESETQEMPYQVSFSATPDKPYEVDTWYAIDADGNETTFGAGQKTVSKTFMAKATVGVRFKARPIVTLTCIDASGNYSVTATGDAVDGTTDSFYNQVKVTLQSDNPNFYSWTVNGKEVFDNPYVVTVTADTTASATFLTADMVAEVTAFDGLVAALANDVKKKVTIPAGVDITIARGSSATIPAGKQLVVDGTLFTLGTLTVEGAVLGSGNLVKSLKVITQTGMGANGQDPYVPYEKMKYFKTAVTEETGTVGGSGTKSCAQPTFVKIVRYNGACSYHALGASTTVVYCSVDLTVANNCIKDFVANYDTLGAAFDGKASSGGWANAYKLGGVAILLANGSISKGSSTNIASSLAVDCACKTLSVSAKQINNTAVILSFNATSASMPKLTSGGAWFVNCDSCKVSEVNVNSDYQSNVRYFDCGKTSAPGYTVTNGDGNGGMFFFAGEYWTYAYTVSFKSYYRVYSGLFKNDPTKYLAENDLEVVKEGSYYRVRKQAPKVLTVQVGDQQYETLQEAVNAANGGKITLLQDIELTGDLTVMAGKVCAIELAGFDISGFSIINHGTLTIEDSSNFDTYGLVSSAITNDGTLKTVYGEYTGAFTAAGGTFTLQGGVYRSSLSGECFDIRSGKFTSDVSARLNGRRIISSGGFFWVGPEIHASKEQKSLSGTDIAFTFSPLDPPEDLALYRKHLTDGFNRSKYSDAEWYRLSELYYSIEPIASCTTECTLCFDRDVEAGSVTGYGKVDIFTKSDAMPSNHPAHVLYWTTIPQIWASGNRPISYNRFLSGDVAVPTAGVKNNSNKNIGTTCTIAFQYGISKEGCWIRDSAGGRMYIDWDFYPLVSHSYKFTGGSKKAMINYELVDTLGGAINAVANDGVIMLANDDDEEIVISREVSFTLDPNNFAFTGSIRGDEANGFSAKRSGDVWTIFRKATDAPVVVKAADGETSVAAVEVEDTWKDQVIKDNGAEGKTEAEQQQIVQEALQKTEANGLKAWENKVLEQAAAKQLSTKTGFAKVNKEEVTVDDKSVVATKVEEAVDEGDLANLETGVYQQTIIAEDAEGKEVRIADTKATAKAVVKNDSEEKTVVLAIPGNVTVATAIASSAQPNDLIKVYDTAIQAYRCWEYTGSEWSPISTWIDGKEIPNETSAEEKPLAAGSVILYEHKTQASGQKVSIVTDYEQDIVSEPLEQGSDVESKWNLMANPTGTPFDLEKIAESETNPKDKIIVLEKDGLGQTTYELKDNKWGRYKTTATMTKTGRLVATREWVNSGKDAVPAGRSMWYISNGGKPQIKWNKK